jgi:hypothetical protein
MSRVLLRVRDDFDRPLQDKALAVVPETKIARLL